MNSSIDTIDTQESLQQSFREYRLFNNSDEFSAQYGCMITFDQGDIKNELRYKQTITLLEKSEYTAVYEVNRDQDFYFQDNRLRI